MLKEYVLHVQSAHIRKLKTLVGPSLARVKAHEPYVPLLYLLGDLQEVTTYALSNRYWQPISVVALAALPTLHTLEVQGRYTATTMFNYIEELTQLKCLRLVDTMPSELPLGLKVLDMHSNSAGSLQSKLPCSLLFEGFRGSLDGLGLGRAIKQFDYNPGRLAAFNCLQQLTSLDLDFEHFSSEACHFTFPHLLSLKIHVREFGVRYPPIWNFNGSPQLQDVTMIIEVLCNDTVDLSQILNLHAASLCIQLDITDPDIHRHEPAGAFHGALNTIGVKLDAATWALSRVEILTPAPAPHIWQDCGQCVQGMLQALMGHVSFTQISVNGVLGSAILG